jgi:hypothetical protein
MLSGRYNILISVFLGTFMGITAQDNTLCIPEYKGEVMHYRLRYGPFKIGHATISCLEHPAGCGDQIKATARSGGMIKILKDLDYRIECCMDPTTGLPKAASRNLRDGKNIQVNELVFDHYSRLDSTVIYSQISGSHVVEDNMLDVLTAFYHFRTSFLSETAPSGQEVVLITFLLNRLWDLRIRHGGDETIKTRYGPVSCYKCYPVTVVGDFFRHEGELTGYKQPVQSSEPSGSSP